MYQYAVTAVYVVDGDTLDVSIDLGFRLTLVERVRLFGVDTPERGEPLWAEARAKLSELVLGVDGVTAHTAKPHEKYGRWLAVLSTPTVPDVSAELIRLGLGRPYFGG